MSPGRKPRVNSRRNRFGAQHLSGPARVGGKRIREIEAFETQRFCRDICGLTRNRAAWRQCFDVCRTRPTFSHVAAWYARRTIATLARGGRIRDEAMGVKVGTKWQMAKKTAGRDGRPYQCCAGGNA